MAYIGQSIKNGTFSVLDTSGNTYNGSNTTFNLGTQVGSPAQLLVSHDGVIQKAGTDYTLASGGTQITFTTAPASGASIFIIEISGAVGGPMNRDINGDELILDVDGDTSITADTDDQIDFKVGGSDKVVIKSDGDVGIGTTAPAGVLHIKDGSIIVGKGDASNNAQIGRIGFSTDSGNSRFIGMESHRGSDAANADLRFHTFGGDSDSGERVRIHTNGVLSASDGIALGVGTNNTASNVLDDYEEGTFTPTFSSSGGAYSISHSGQQGKYTKIGQTVVCHFLCSASGTPSGGSGDFRLTGLPFTPADTSTIPGGHGMVGIINNTNINVDAVQLMFNLGSADTFANLMFITDSSSVTSTSNAPNTIIHANGPRIDGTLVYRTAS